jgi:hypothetical protein
MELGSSHSPDDCGFPGWRASLQRKQSLKNLPVWGLFKPYLKPLH